MELASVLLEDRRGGDGNAGPRQKLRCIVIQERARREILAIAGKLEQLVDSTTTSGESDR